MTADKISKLFDSYNRIARIYPSFVVLAPVLWSTAILSPNLIPNISKGMVAIAIVGCLLYALASLARSRGKVVEKQLIKEWGGWLTTVLLRHSDRTIDPITKARYHSKLSVLCDGMAFPTIAEEQQSPINAENVYRSATKRLIEARRGIEYQLLHDENASYGFRRNLLGLKPIALTLGVIAIAVTGAAWALTIPIPITVAGIVSMIERSPALPALFGLDIGYLLLWIFLIQKHFVFQAAREYAEALFRTLDFP